ncbi:5-methyltetrahydropteroyltriglutamate-homocysteine S-methyltransferase [Candidatus Blochmanniella floridana]|uniref:5-methyltetrahydropteroyltriglutamate--homocysteine methyltransferase n=1 Tax=Blochmanniella floridana TaxID=203907 RepID=METE_BLOFL|nr:RecName: Full=5-methyltetrahydropteroyltriglutamate--homocysteine methyltransferase; AltName: Full=Cobalamin-independent methionine synthase; AltName: Full=Methionine synthase, vitamin-B12 independent isozyme [Candidatus Blochmannia floridanus]CAD83300.1 5-methyltetrahydropteroyltriglutamate-homocysteine S-methyltransferase [Candidatus Blochmannia floridanus]
MPVLSHILGFPRIGLYRELKHALEQYWEKKITENKLLDIGRMLRMRHWKQQINSGINLIPIGDFSWYDHVLDMSIMLNNIPTRFHILSQKKNTLNMLFSIARGDSINNTTITPSEMKKWFNTNYHYIVPEFVQNQIFKLNCTQLLAEIDEALSLNHPIKPVLLGPLTYLWIGKTKETKEFDRLSLLPSLLLVYKEIFNILSKKNIQWIQIDEPALVLELPQTWLKAYLHAYDQLYQTKIKLLLTTYFGKIYHQLPIIKQLKVNGLHIDLTNCSDNDISLLHEQLPKKWILSAGIINGKNIWKTNLYDWFLKLNTITHQRSLWIGSSCSLLHSPIDLNIESKLNNNIKNWFAFAIQKCSEIKLLCDALNSNHNDNSDQQNILKKYYNTNIQRLNSNIINNPQVQERCKNIITLDHSRKTKHITRMKLQHNRFNLPLYPTTTIGSFPQTSEIRKLRLKFKNKQINEDYYYTHIQQYIKKIIQEQEKLDLDILVHGEPERNDMVEYFGENLKGFVSSQHGWIQSYGSRCIKPPIIIGDISRPIPITIPWINYAQSLTNKPVKGILTGPITIMTWSFAREDIPRHMIALQLALAIRDEVMDLEKSGIGVIQIDEPALREGLPLKKSEQSYYLKWAINTFKITVSSVKDNTQIHTHMCYSEFNEIIDDILKLDVDVISIESSRSDLQLLQFIKTAGKKLNEIGPGIYDIHSIHQPSINEIMDKLKKLLQYIPKDRLWINPDCGLKTRSWNEIRESLNNMVIAAKTLRINNGLNN